MKFSCTILLACLLLTLSKCKIETHSSDEADLKILLKWHPSYAEETPVKVEIGLKWILSYLGAFLPQKDAGNLIKWQENNVLELNLLAAGFSEKADNIWKVLLKEMKKSEEYQVKKSLDLGRFVMLTLNSSWHYYAITDVSPDLQTFKEKYNFDDKDDFVIREDESCVADGMRIVNSANAESIFEIAHIAKEGYVTKASTFDAKEFEVFDVMENGQLRFAIYGKDGQLKSAADTLYGNAGKPSKCIWCHESIVSQLFLAKTDTEGFLTMEETSSLISKQNYMIYDFHRQTNSALDFSQKRAHSFAELIYVGFGHPDKNRLQNEWAFSEDELEELDSFITEDINEYQFMEISLNKRYERKEIKKLTPYQAIDTPDMRELSENEPDFVKIFK